MSTLTVSGSYWLADADVIIGEGDTRYVLRVRDLPMEEKPREKLLSSGVSSLSHVELMSIVLGVGTRKEEVMAMAGRVIREYGGNTIAQEKEPLRMAEALQIPVAKACQIVASYELGRRAFLRKNGKPVFVRAARHAYDHLKSMGNLKKEQLRGLYLNSRYQVIHEEVISTGSVTATIVHPREVFQPALEHGAVAVVVAHNHPSGDTEPTSDDLRTTKQLIAAGRLLGIELLDHLVITDGAFVSMIERSKENE